MTNRQKIKSNSFRFNITMLDVIIAMIPALFAGLYFHGLNALIIVLTSVISCVAFEALWNITVLKKQWMTDLSPVVTGIILAFILPVSVPIWIPVTGAAFAIILVKLVFGGLNNNFMNPAVAAKAFLVASWGTIISTSVVNIASTDSLVGAFIGQSVGNIGETSVLALMLGGVYLLVRRVISGYTTISFLAAFIAFNYMISADGWFKGNGLQAVVSGAVIITAIFLINDKATTPQNTLGQMIFGVSTALISTIFIVYGNNPNGAYYAVILMNLFTPLIKHFTKASEDFMEVLN